MQSCDLNELIFTVRVDGFTTELRIIAARYTWTIGELIIWVHVPNMKRIPKVKIVKSSSLFMH